MTLKNYRTLFIDKLTALYDAMEAEQFFYWVLEELKGWRRVDLALNPDMLLTQEEQLQWDAIMQKLEQYTPIQYILGKAHFYGLVFKVTKDTLIPRPETEELVAWISKDNEFKSGVQVLDIGTGSGCIAVSLAKNLTEAKVSAIDVSSDALAVAKVNAKANGAEVTFYLQDILATEKLPQQYDVIVSNPPYVRELEKAEIKQNVLEYEPHLALFVPDVDALLFYRKIALLAKGSLNPGGRLYFEINQYLGPETVAMLEQYGYTNIILKQDMYGNNRMVAASLPV